jgi:magnesium transporter
MIEIFKTTEAILTRLSAPEEDCWLNLINPSEKEIEQVAGLYSLPADFLINPLDADERARFEVEDKKVLIVLRVPHYEEKELNTPYVTVPVGIIIAKDAVITVCSRPVAVLQDFIQNRIKNLSTATRSRFVLNVFLRTAISFLDHLKAINKRTAELESRLNKAMRNAVLMRLLSLEKCLVYFNTSLRANELMMERLQSVGVLKMYEDDKDLLDDVITENRQAIEMAGIYSNILSGMMDAFASIINNNVNVVMKFLTSITIILMIPTLIASIYGMNVPLPFQHSPYAFVIVMTISFVVSTLSVLVFIRKRYF